MSVTAWLKAFATLIAIVYRIMEAVEAYEERERGRLQVLLELRQKRDQEKAKADEIDSRPVPPDDRTVIGSL